jgi:hypothetical protein
MSKDKLRKAIEKLCISSRIKLRTDGDKDVLERRYREFVHLNNAQIGSIDPLGVEAIVKEINTRETRKEREAKKSEITGRMKAVEGLKNGIVSTLLNGYRCEISVS